MRASAKESSVNTIATKIRILMPMSALVTGKSRSVPVYRPRRARETARLAQASQYIGATPSSLTGTGCWHFRHVGIASPNTIVAKDKAYHTQQMWMCRQLDNCKIG